MTKLRDDARWIVNEIAEAKAMAKALGKPQLGTSSIESGRIEEYDAEGTLSQIIGEQHDGTHTTSTVSGPVPPEPMPPSVTVGIGSAEVRANGKFVDGAMSPMDLSHFAVHASRLEVFSPDNESQKSTIQGESGDLSVILIEPGVWTFGLVAVSKAGKWSAMSETVAAEILDYPSPLDIQQELIDLDEKYDGVITEAGNLGTRLEQAETDLDLAGDRLDDAGTRLDTVFGEVAAIPTAINAARQAAINAAASDAQTKVDAASALANAQIAQIIAKGQSLVRNGDFEARDVAWSAGTGITWTQSAARSGAWSLQMRPATANLSSFSEWVPASPGRSFYAEFWVYEGGVTDIVGRVAVVAQVKTSLGAVVTHYFGHQESSAITNYSWTKISGLVTPGTADIVAIRFGPWAESPSTSSYLVDDFLAVDVTEAQAAIQAAEAARVLAVAAQAAAGSAQITADNALTMAGSKARVYYSTSAPSGTATDRDVWRQINTVKDVIGEWFWDATLSTPGWVKTLISSQSISNLDVGKLTVGTGIISDLVAEHIAGRSARFIQLDVSQLVAVTGTMSEAVITKLFTDVVMSRKITAEMLAIGSFDNIIAEPDFSNGGKSWASVAAWDINPTGSEGGGPSGRLMTNATNQDFFNLPYRRRIDGGSSYLVKLRVRSTVTIPANAVWLIARTWSAAGVNTWVNIMSGVARAANTWHTIPFIFEVPAAAVSIDIGFSARTALAGGELNISTVSATRMANGELVVDGSIKAIHADLESFAANTGFVADLTARIVKSDMFVGKEFIGGIFTGATFQTSVLPNSGLKLTSTGLRAYPVESGEPTVEILPDGATTFAINDPLTGEQLSTLGNDGSISGQTLSIADQARVDGVLVSGGDALVEIAYGGTEPGKYGPVHNGRALFGTNFTNRVEEDPATTDYTSWMEAVPYGVASNGWIQSTSSWGWQGLGSQPHYRIVMAVTAELVSGRGYLLSFRAPPFEQTTTVGALTPGANIGGCFVRYSAPNGGVSANGSGNVLPGTLQYIPGGGTSYTPQGTTYIRCPEDVPAGKIMFGIEAYVYAGRSMITPANVNANRWEIVVADNGPRRALNDSVAASSSQQGTESPPAAIPPAPARPKLQTTTFDYSWYGSYNADNTPYDYAKLNTKVVQGLGPGASGGVKKGMIAFPSLQPTLSGATVKKIEVYLYTEHWYSSAGGLLGIGTHSSAATSKPGAFVSTSLNITAAKTQKPEGRWVTLPASTHAGFQAGTLRGIVLRPASNSSAVVHYGFVNPSQTGKKARIRVTYLK